MKHLIKQLPASAFILAGGKSKRFESPKWKAMLGGITLLQRSWNLCTDLFESISIVAKSNYDFGEKRLIQDILNVQAPLTGIYTALKQSEHKWNFIISCDLPFISEEIILKLWDPLKSFKIFQNPLGFFGILKILWNLHNAVECFQCL